MTAPLSFSPRRTSASDPCHRIDGKIDSDIMFEREALIPLVNLDREYVAFF